jgi:hypothetical protein
MLEISVPHRRAAIPNRAGVASGNHSRWVTKSPPAVRTAGHASASRKAVMARSTPTTVAATPVVAYWNTVSPARPRR